MWYIFSVKLSQKQVLSNIKLWYGESMVWINEIVLLYYQIGNFVLKNEKEIYPQNYTPISLRIWEVWKIPSKCMIFSFVTTYEVLRSFLWSYWHYTFMKRAPNLPFEAHLQVSFFQSHFLLNSLYFLHMEWSQFGKKFKTLSNFD